jgi:hypothetical protein
MTTQNEEKMREEFEKWVGDRFDLTPDPEGTVFAYLTAYAEGAWRAYKQAHYAATKQMQSRIDLLEAQVKKYESALLFSLYHHQGASSIIGQPIRRLLGMLQYDNMTTEQIEQGKNFAYTGDK